MIFRYSHRHRLSMQVAVNLQGTCRSEEESDEELCLIPDGPSECGPFIWRPARVTDRRCDFQPAQMALHACPDGDTVRRGFSQRLRRAERRPQREERLQSTNKKPVFRQHRKLPGGIVTHPKTTLRSIGVDTFRGGADRVV